MNTLHVHLPRASKSSVAARLLLFCVRGYQYLLSPYFGTQCRFTPTCSHYAADALTKHGALKGGVMAAGRILRCHPGRPGGFDPVP